jgi:hypothetical protein
MSEALELSIEGAWLELARMGSGQRRTIYMTACRGLVWPTHYKRGLGLIEIGTYTRDVTLADLRADVFWTHAQTRKVGDYG